MLDGLLDTPYKTQTSLLWPQIMLLYRLLQHRSWDLRLVVH